MTISARSFGGQKIGDSTYGPNIHTIAAETPAVDVAGPFRATSSTNNIIAYDGEGNAIGYMAPILLNELNELRAFGCIGGVFGWFTISDDVSDNKNIWYLDTVNGLDTNSGLSRSAPKKTGDAVVIACKTAGKTTGRLVVMAGSSGVVFNAATWANTTFPFFDVVCESFNTDIVWNAVNSSVRLHSIGGAHRFNGCNLSGSISMKCRTVVASGGDWNGEININAGDIFVDGLRCWGMSFFVTPFMHVQSTFMLGGEALIQALKINGAGSIYSYNNEAIKLEIQSTKFELEGQLSFPSQQGFSSFKISTMSMKRAATTGLLYLGAFAKVTVNYQIIVDTMGSIVPLEIANPAGTVAGKVIELLKYENKVDSEISRATAAEALKEDKSKKNAASGYCPLDANVKVPFANIPDSILGQLEYRGVWDASAGNFPTATESGQYWIASSNGAGATISYSTGDWTVYNGTAFDKVDNSDAVFSVNGRLGNVVLEKADVGLGNVDNTSDVNKPVSAAQQTALDLKANQTSISNINNTSDANKPVSTATQTALDLKANKLTTVNNSTAAAYTFLASDSNTCHIVNTSTSTTRTVPSDTTAPDIAIGDSIEVQNIGTGVVTFVAASGVTIRSSLTLVMYGQYSVCMLRKIAANTWILTGERTAV